MTLREILAHLRERGYQVKFRREAFCIYSIELNQWIMPDSFMVDEFHHISDNENPDGERTVYAISSTDGLRGCLVDTCFVYEDNISLELMQKLKWEYEPAEAI